MKINQSDIVIHISEFQKNNQPNDRYSSFDYCYYYFHPTSSNDLLNDMEKSCLSIGFYLASWGMLRGSSFLLNKSIKYYEPLIEYISELDPITWNIDVDSYNSDNINLICTIYQDIKDIIIKENNVHLILVTKIMLGIFGFIPAFDNYFCNTFRQIFGSECRFRSVNNVSLSCIHQFYKDNKDDIDNFSSGIFVKEFSTGEDTNINYPKSKIIDMYGFAKGLSNNL